MFGHWDAITGAETKNLKKLSRLVISRIRGIHGVQDADTVVHARTQLRRDSNRLTADT